MEYSILYIACFLLGCIGTWFIFLYGKSFGLLDKANDRSSHQGVVPKGGGIGIVAAFIVCSLLLQLPPVFWVCAGFASLYSFYGDRKEILPEFRLCIQFLAGIVMLFGLFYLEGRPCWRYLLIPIFSVFVVGTANFYNFMDGIDGIAGITGIVAFGLIALFQLISGADNSLHILAACMTFACLGFLPFNIPKARVFMGDVGSILLGFVFAGLVVWISKNVLDLVCTAAFLFPFYADELTTMIVRLKDGDRLTTPHRKHLYQLLANDIGIAHWKISLAYGTLQLIVGVSILLLKRFESLVIIAALAVYFSAFALFSATIRKKIKPTA